jgi:hypothetical protein
MRERGSSGVGTWLSIVRFGLTACSGCASVSGLDSLHVVQCVDCMDSSSGDAPPDSGVTPDVASTDAPSTGDASFGDANGEDGGFYSVGGQLAGLTPGELITLQDNLGDDLTVSSNGPFTFPTSLPAGATYDVTISAAPSSPIIQTCTVSNAGGTVQRNSVSNVTVDCDLLAYYPFQGDANDASGYGHNGVVTGASLAADRNGNANSAYAFNGSGSILAAMPTGFLPAGEAARTLTAWMKPTQTTSMLGVIYWGGGNCTGQVFGLGDNGDVANFWGGCDDYASSLAIPVNAWTFAAIVYSPAIPTTITFYVGDLSGTGSLATPLATPDSETLYMGMDDQRSFTGILGSIRVYGHALGAAEVESIFLSSAP